MPARAKADEHIRSLIGDPKRVDGELRRFRRSAQLLSSRHARLIDKYPKQWVALHDGKLMARARTFDSLMTQVDRKKLPRAHIVVRYIDKTQRTLIL